MMKRKPRRSREFKKNNQVIDIAEARELRRERREQRLLQEQEQRLRDEEKKLSTRKQRQRRNRRLVYFCGFLLILVLLVYCVWDIGALYIERQRVQNEQENLLLQKEALEEELKNVNDPKYIEQQARLQLRLIMPGETLFILPKAQAEGDGATENESNN